MLSDRGTGKPNGKGMLTLFRRIAAVNGVFDSLPWLLALADEERSGGTRWVRPGRLCEQWPGTSNTESNYRLHTRRIRETNGKSKVARGDLTVHRSIHLFSRGQERIVRCWKPHRFYDVSAASPIEPRYANRHAATLTTKERTTMEPTVT